ncbi:hypothetical protein HAALTHF_27750n [Vreelandella aquamarina]|nr:hypothetical protein HAALTHF_27750n [Halomonas axialensis]
MLEQRDPFPEELRNTLEQAGFTLSDQVDLVSMISQGGALPARQPQSGG